MGRKVRRDCEPFCLAYISDDKKKKEAGYPSRASNLHIVD